MNLCILQLQLRRNFRRKAGKRRRLSSSHSAAVGEDGALFVWGFGRDGQLGTDNTDGRLAPTRGGGLPAPVRQGAAGDDHTTMVNAGGAGAV